MRTALVVCCIVLSLAISGKAGYEVATGDPFIGCGMLVWGTVMSIVGWVNIRWPHVDG